METYPEWERIFKDPLTTAAAIDRLVHHSVILELNLPSYRMEAAKRQKSNHDVGNGKAAMAADLIDKLKGNGKSNCRWNGILVGTSALLGKTRLGIVN